MQLLERRVNNILIVSVNGDVQLDEALQLQREVLATIDDEINTVLLDLSGARLVTSSGLSAILNIYKKMRERNGDFAVCGARDIVASALETSRFADIFSIYPDETAALAALKKEKTG